MRVLVTGATGSFGTPICRQLAHRGYEVLAMARNEPAQLPVGVNFVRGDVQDPASMKGAVAGVDAVVHLAWLVASARESVQAEGINVVGTQNVLDAMRDEGVSRLIFASSVMGYGSQASHGAYTEDEPLRAEAGFLYGYHKRLVEDRIRRSGVPHLIVRTAPVVGRTVRNVVTDQFAGPAVMGVAGDDSLWQFVHSDDVTRFLVSSVDTKATGIVNLACDGGLTLEQVAELLGKRLVRLPSRVASGAIRLAWKLGVSDIDPAALTALRHLPIADTSKLHRDFGFECAWSNEEAVADMRRSLITYFHLGTVDAPRRSYLPFAESGWRPDMTTRGEQRLVVAVPPVYRGELDDKVDPEAADYRRADVEDGSDESALMPLSLELALLSLRASTVVTSRLLGLEGHLAHESVNRVVVSLAHRIFVNVTLLRQILAKVPHLRLDAEPQNHREAGRVALERSRLSILWTYRKVARTSGLAVSRFASTVQWLVEHVEQLTASSADPAALTDAELDARLSALVDAFVDGSVVQMSHNLISAAASTTGHYGVIGGYGPTVARSKALIRPPAHAIATSAIRHGQRIAGACGELDRALRTVLLVKGSRLVAAGSLVAPDDIFYLTIDEIFCSPGDTRELVAARGCERSRLSALEVPRIVNRISIRDIAEFPNDHEPLPSHE